MLFLYLSIFCALAVMVLFRMMTRPNWKAKKNPAQQRFFIKVLLAFFVFGVVSFVAYMLEGRGGPPAALRHELLHALPSVTTIPASEKMVALTVPIPDPPSVTTLPTVATCRGGGCPGSWAPVFLYTALGCFLSILIVFAWNPKFDSINKGRMIMAFMAGAFVLGVGCLVTYMIMNGG